MKKYSLRIVVITFSLICMMFGSSCSMAEKQTEENVREKLIIAYQFLEQMEYESALDAFSAVIEIDEKQIDAYIGLSRAYSAIGKHIEARDIALSGFEVTGSESLENLGDSCSIIVDSEEELKNIVELLRTSEEKIPTELSEDKSGLLSESLDNLWEYLDWSNIYQGINNVLIYPVDPKENVYLLIYPDGHIYLGEVTFTPYSQVLALEENLTEQEEQNLHNDKSALIIPNREGYGLWAGIDLTSNIADFYFGKWHEGYPEDSDAFYIYQELPSGNRFAFYGSIEKASFKESSNIFGSTDIFLEVANGLEQDTGALMQEMSLNKVNPFDKDFNILMNPVIHEMGYYDSDFNNRTFFELLDSTEKIETFDREKLKRNQSGSPVFVDGLLYHFGDSLYVSSFNTEHGLYILFEDIKDLNIPCYVVDSKGQTLFSTYQGMAWFTDSGFAGLHIIESTDDPLIEGENAQVGDVYLVVYDWEGNELSISYKGKRENANEFSEYREINGIYGYHSDETAPGSTVQGERRNDGFYFKDLLGNDIGAVHLNSTEGWNYVINGRMIRIVGDSYGQNYLFLAVY